MHKRPVALTQPRRAARERATKGGEFGRICGGFVSLPPGASYLFRFAHGSPLKKPEFA